jgi:hypothetical protein
MRMFVCQPPIKPNRRRRIKASVTYSGTVGGGMHQKKNDGCNQIKKKKKTSSYCDGDRRATICFSFY